MKTIFTIAGTIIITLLMMDLFNAKPKLKKVRIIKDEILEKKGIKTLENIEKTNIQQQSTDTGKKKDENKIKNVPLKEVKNPPTPKAVIPKYTVQRVDRLSGAFEQGKIYVTVEKSSSNESLKLLCEKLKKHYKEFSNIIICLYTNNDAGLLLAQGLEIKVNAKEKKKAWLAMYTYNPVEGEYFDNNPGGYLGTY